MKMKLTRVPLQTRRTQELIKITEEIEQAIADSGVQNGLVTIASTHTTAGITVNEGVECVQADITAFLERLAPKDGPYRHARYLDEWGGSAANAETHLRTLLTGISVSLPVENGKMVKGGLQAVYFVELDGPAARTVVVQVMGE